MKVGLRRAILAIIAIVLVIGAVAICFYGEYSIRKDFKSDVTNAKQVLAPRIEGDPARS
jgi:hypothetical protein